MRKNITTNELVNHARYKYISFDPDYNYFDQGLIKNVCLYFGYGEEDTNPASVARKARQSMKAVVRENIV